MSKFKQVEIYLEKKDWQKRSIVLEGVSENDRYLPYLEGRAEGRFQQLFECILPDDAICFDFGGNIGIIAAILDTVCPNGIVHTFEPAPDIFNILQRNIKANELSTVKAHQIGVMDCKGSIDFFQDSAFGHAISSDEDPQRYIDRISVTCDTMDDIVQQLAPTRLDIVKIDIEGFEPHAFEHCKWTVDNLDPIFLMEINPWTIYNYGKRNPEEFTRWIFNTFNHVFIINKDYSQRNPIRHTSFDEIIRNFPTDYSVFNGDEWLDDLVFCNHDGILKGLNPDW